MEDKATKSTAKVVLNVQYELNHEDIVSIKNHLESTIKWMMAQHAEPGDAVVGSWLCNLEVEEV